MGALAEQNCSLAPRNHLRRETLRLKFPQFDRCGSLYHAAKATLLPEKWLGSRPKVGLECLKRIILARQRLTPYHQNRSRNVTPPAVERIWHM